MEAVRERGEHERGRPAVVHDLNCHLDFIKDKLGGEGERTRKRGNERRARPCLLLWSSSNMRINGRVAENVHEYNRWPDGREREESELSDSHKERLDYSMQWSL